MSVDQKCVFQHMQEKGAELLLVTSKVQVFASYEELF